MAKRPASSKEPTITGAELRALLGITDRTLSRWFDDGLVCTRDAHGKTPVVRYRDLLLFVYNRKPIGDGPADGSVSASLERLRVAKAEAAERENAIRMGELIRRDEAVAQVRVIGHALRSILEAVVRANPSVEPLIATAFDDTIKRLEEQFPEKPKA